MSVINTNINTKFTKGYPNTNTNDKTNDEKQMIINKYIKYR